MTNWLLAQSSGNSSGGGFWMPTPASTVAGDVDNLFSFILWITVFFFLLVTTLTFVFVLKYRHREGQPPPPKAAAHNTALELTWTIIPTIIVLIVFYFGFRGFLHMSVIPPNAYEINVTASMWTWQFTYPNGYVDSELHIPKDVPVRLVLSSNDVIHSLYVPQFRVKKDVVPGRFNRFWVQATETSPPEGFDIYCAEYCGNGHSRMLSKCYVHELDDYKKWLEDASNWEKHMSPTKAGEQFFNTRGCTQCHTVTGAKLIGPSLKNLFGEQVQLTDGRTITADEDYIRESLYDPNAKIVLGYTPQMPSYKATLKDKDVLAIIEYLKSVSEKHSNDTINLNAPTTRPQQ